MNADGSGDTRITFTPGNEVDPVWVPGENAVAFSCPASGGGAVCVKAADGSGDVRVIAQQAELASLFSRGALPSYAVKRAGAAGIAVARQTSTGRTARGVRDGGRRPPTCRHSGGQSICRVLELQRQPSRHDRQAVSQRLWYVGTADTAEL